VAEDVETAESNTRAKIKETGEKPGIHAAS
jgi:hypothetical protein